MDLCDYIAEIEDDPPDRLRQAIERHLHLCTTSQPLGASGLTSEEKLRACLVVVMARCAFDPQFAESDDIRGIKGVLDTHGVSKGITEIARVLTKVLTAQKGGALMIRPPSPANG